jgi:serine/threonine protein kinase/predicted Zn-dependent protease
MTPERGVAPNELSRLEALWDSARGLTPNERDELLASDSVDGALRDELESLLARADSAEEFFGRLRGAIPDARVAMRNRRELAENGDDDALLGTTVGHYQIVARLGRGGMGVVYEALDVRLRRTVALKLVRAQTPHDVGARERLLSEARAAAALDHPNICTIYEVGETDDHLPYIAMAFYTGETLEQVIRRGPLSVPTALAYATQIARGLDVAHERGIIHRDVKPANIVITADGVVKLLDFGIARIVDGGASHESVTPGTIAYMSPEQVESGALDARTDLWSLGVVLYEMCTGVRPFDGENAAATLYAIVHESPPLPRKLRQNLPADLETVIAQLLVKDPDQRCTDARQLVSSLETISGLRTHSTQSTTALPGKHRGLWRYAVATGVAGLALTALISLWRRPSLPAVSDRRLAAEDLYGQANRDVLFRTDSGRQQSLALFEQAVAVDSTYAAAQAALAHILVMNSEDRGGARRVQLQLAEKAARASISLDSTLSDAHSALGHVLLFDYQFTKAEEQFKRAVALDPTQRYVGDFLVWLYVFMDEPHQALEQANRSLSANPGSPSAIAETARALLVNGRCTEALALLGRLAYLQPPPARAAAIAAQCYARVGKWDRAIAVMRPVTEHNPLMSEPWLGYVLARAGRIGEAEQVKDTLLARWREGRGGAYNVAMVYAGLRQLDSAFVWLDRSVDDRSLRYNIMEPAFEELRRDPRFDRLRTRLGIYKH